MTYNVKAFVRKEDQEGRVITHVLQAENMETARAVAKQRLQKTNKTVRILYVSCESLHVNKNLSVEENLLVAANADSTIVGNGIGNFRVTKLKN